MNIISILNQKGGSGKTTLATHLARSFQLKGYEVLLADSDPQGSARDWAAAKEEQPLIVIGMDRPTLDRDLKRIANKDIIVVDGAPQLKDLATSAVKASNLVLIPVQPSPYDIWATSDLVDLVKQRIEITEGLLKAAFVVSRVITGTKVGKEIFDILSEYGLPVLKSFVSQRIVFSASAGSGETALDQSLDSQASKEILALANEVLEFAGII